MWSQYPAGYEHHSQTEYLPEGVLNRALLLK